MGKTITEKILAKASGKGDVSPGEYVHVGTRRPVVLGGIGRGMDKVTAVGAKKVFNRKLLKIVDGHFGATPASSRVAEVRRAFDEWARQMGVPREKHIQACRGGDRACG